MAHIELNHIYKDYSDDVRAVTDFDLEIQDREFIVLVGPSGCGKSTTLRMIAGLEDITSGEVIIDGRKQNDLAPKDRDIAMVFQNYALYPHMTVYENLAFGLKMAKMDEATIDKRVREAAAILQIEELLERKPAELSGGQRQRVALGRAIAREAKVFLMDEPLSNLDAKLRFQMRSEITDLHRRVGATTIYVTHDQTEAMSMASRIVIMNKGLIQQVGTPKEVYLRPANLFVGQFIGSPAMNFFDTVLSNGEISLENEVLIDLDKTKQAELGIRIGSINDLIVGIRPEHIFWLTEPSEALSDDEAFTMRVTVDHAEFLGLETLVYFTLGDKQFISRFNTLEEFIPGQEITFQVPYEWLYFFDRKTGLAVYLDDEVKNA